MKLVIDGCEVTITAKDLTGCKTQKETAMWILNMFSSYAYEAGESYEKHGWNGLAERAYEVARACHDANAKEGYYDDVR